MYRMPVVSTRMKKLIIALALMLITTPALAMEPDKMYHMGASSIIGFSSGVILGNTVLKEQPIWVKLLCNTGVTLIPGTLKEMTDVKFDMRDMAANLAGALAGVLAAEAVTQFVIIPSDGGVAVSYWGSF